MTARNRSWHDPKDREINIGEKSSWVRNGIAAHA
jgi:hypothetical protein